jgi:hypothetical protein
LVIEKTKGRRRIQDLQTEVCDGTVLCEVIEAVTQQRVPDVNRKPKNNSTMITNIQACLNFLLAKVKQLRTRTIFIAYVASPKNKMQRGEAEGKTLP